MEVLCSRLRNVFHYRNLSTNRTPEWCARGRVRTVRDKSSPNTGCESRSLPAKNTARRRTFKANNNRSDTNTQHDRFLFVIRVPTAQPRHEFEAPATSSHVTASVARIRFASAMINYYCSFILS